MIRMLVTDLDGTLLRDDKTVSAITKDALRRCREAGIKVVYATGRGDSAKDLAPFELFDGYIANNGARAYAGEEVVYSRLVPYQSARPVLIACDKRGLKAAAQWAGQHYANFVVEKVWHWIHAYEVIDFAELSIDAEKLYVADCGAEETAFIETLLPPELWLTVGRDALGQIMHWEATKSNAVAALARHWGLEQNQIAAFGDDLNDIDLLRYAGMGVAMGNALDEVKAVADEITLTNEEDGLAVWLEGNGI